MPIDLISLLSKSKYPQVTRSGEGKGFKINLMFPLCRAAEIAKQQGFGCQ
jgi:predicted ABC-type ATPase